MKTIKVPKRLWYTFCSLLSIAHYHATKGVDPKDLNEEEQEVLKRIDKLLKKEGWS